MFETIPIPAWIIGGYILLLYVISFYTARLSSRGGMVGYFLAGRGLPAGVTAVMLTGLAVGGASTVGVAQRAYTDGLAAGWYNTAWAFGALVMGLFAAARYRRMEVATLPEFFERHYGVAGRLLGVAGQLVIQVVITSLQYVAGGAILHALLPGIFPDFETGMYVTAAVFVGITLIGGLWAAGLTNVINVILIYVGVVLGSCLLLSDAAGQAGGFNAFRAALGRLDPPNPGFALSGIGSSLVLAWFLVMTVTVLGTQSVVQISFASKTPSAARGGFLLGALLILPVGFISALIGLSAAVLHPGLANTAEALPRAVLGLSPVLAGLILAGLWAADVSTACGLLLGGSTLVVGDILKRFFLPRLGERGEWWVSRGAVLALSIVTLALALSVTDILKTLLAGLSLNTAYGLITLMTLFCPSLCRRGSAAWTLLGSMGSFGAWFVLPGSLRQELVHPIFIVLPVTVLVFFAVRLIDPRPVRAAAGEANLVKP